MKKLLLVLLLSTPLQAQESCPTDFEIWEEGSGVRNKFASHKACEENYLACAYGNELCFGILSAIQNVPPPPSNICTGKWGGGNLYRPKSNRGAPVVVLKQSYCFEDRTNTGDMKPLNIWITDIAGNHLDGGEFRYCNQINEGRLHHDFPKSAGINGAIQISVEYEDGSRECFDVPDATKEYR